MLSILIKSFLSAAATLLLLTPLAAYAHKVDARDADPRTAPDVTVACAARDVGPQHHPAAKRVTFCKSRQVRVAQAGAADRRPVGPRGR